MSHASRVGRVPSSLRAPLATALVFVLSYAAARAGIAVIAPDSPWRVAAAFLPVLPFGAFLWAMVGQARALDELQRRIHLEALAAAFLCFMLALMTLGLVELVVTLPEGDLRYRHVWAFMPVFYFAALGLAQRRYT